MLQRPYLLTAVLITAGLTACLIVAWLFRRPDFAATSLFIAYIAILGCWLLRNRERVLLTSTTWQINATAKKLIPELYAMNAVLYPAFGKHMPVSGWSMQFSNIHAIIRLIESHQPKTVVEFGSGFSTLAIARALSHIEGSQLISFDHIEEWAALTNRQLSIEGLAEKATVRHRHLAPTETGDAWYSIKPNELSGVTIDLLVIDGPPAAAQSTARYPALPILKHHLSDHAIIVLDDAHRDGEQQVANAWVKEFPDFSLEQIESFSGLAILRRKANHI